MVLIPHIDSHYWHNKHKYDPRHRLDKYTLRLFESKGPIGLKEQKSSGNLYTNIFVFLKNSSNRTYIHTKIWAGRVYEKRKRSQIAQIGPKSMIHDIERLSIIYDIKSTA